MDIDSNWIYLISFINFHTFELFLNDTQTIFFALIFLFMNTKL